VSKLSSVEVSASLRSAIEKIDGYYSQRANEPLDTTFVRAKAECLAHLRRQIECVECVSLEQFCTVRRFNMPDFGPLDETRRSS
jgi:hypothetical protein